MAKSIGDQFASFALLNLGIAVVTVIAWPFVGLPVTAAWVYIGGSTLCHFGYELFLMGSYRRGDFSQSYPVARGAAPVFVSIGGLLFASEHLGWRGALGVAAVVVGIASLAALPRRWRREPQPPGVGAGDRGRDRGLQRGRRARRARESRRPALRRRALRHPVDAVGRRGAGSRRGRVVAAEAHRWPSASWPGWSRPSLRSSCSGLSSERRWARSARCARPGSYGPRSSARSSSASARLRRVALPAVAVVLGIALLSGA